MNIKANNITEDNFKKFGKIAVSQKTEPTSFSKDYKFWSNIADYKILGTTEIGICTVYKQTTNEITMMERHLNTPEILIPIDAPFILPLLLDGEWEDQAEAFKVDIGEAVIINEAVWHGACLPIDKMESSYFVIFRKGTPLEDVEKKEIKKIKINFP